MEGVRQAAQDKNPYNQKVRIIAGRKVILDGEGFFRDPHQWDEEVAESLAKEAGLGEFSEIQWMILKFLRDYYFQNGRAPLNRQIKQGTGISLMEMEALFPGGIKDGARRLAGLPNPKSCA